MKNITKFNCKKLQYFGKNLWKNTFNNDKEVTFKLGGIESKLKYFLNDRLIA